MKKCNDIQIKFGVSRSFYVPIEYEPSVFSKPIVKVDIDLIEFLDFKSLLDLQINALPNNKNNSDFEIIVAKKYKKFLYKLGDEYRGIKIY